jgi:hypothetical protein
VDVDGGRSGWQAERVGLVAIETDGDGLRVGLVIGVEGGRDVADEGAIAGGDVFGEDGDDVAGGRVVAEAEGGVEVGGGAEWAGSVEGLGLGVERIRVTGEGAEGEGESEEFRVEARSGVGAGRTDRFHGGFPGAASVSGIWRNGKSFLGVGVFPKDKNKYRGPSLRSG